MDLLNNKREYQGNKKVMIGIVVTFLVIFVGVQGYFGYREYQLKKVLKYLDSGMVISKIYFKWEKSGSHTRGREILLTDSTALNSIWVYIQDSTINIRKDKMLSDYRINLLIILDDWNEIYMKVLLNFDRPQVIFEFADTENNGFFAFDNPDNDFWLNLIDEYYPDSIDF